MFNNAEQTTRNLSALGVYYQNVEESLYQAVSFYLNHNTYQAWLLRHRVATHIQANLQKFAAFIQPPAGKSIADYINDIRNGKEWVDNIVLEVLMRVLDRPIVVVNPDGKIRNHDDELQLRFKGEPIFLYYNGHNQYYVLSHKNKTITAQQIIKNLAQSSEYFRTMCSTESMSGDVGMRVTGFNPTTIIPPSNRDMSSSSFGNQNSGLAKKLSEGYLYEKEYWKPLILDAIDKKNDINKETQNAKQKSSNKIFSYKINNVFFNRMNTKNFYHNEKLGISMQTSVNEFLAGYKIKFGTNFVDTLFQEEGIHLKNSILLGNNFTGKQFEEFLLRYNNRFKVDFLSLISTDERKSFSNDICSLGEYAEKNNNTKVLDILVEMKDLKINYDHFNEFLSHYHSQSNLFISSNLNFLSTDDRKFLSNDISPLIEYLKYQKDIAISSAIGKVKCLKNKHEHFLVYIKMDGIFLKRKYVYPGNLNSLSLIRPPKFSSSNTYVYEESNYEKALICMFKYIYSIDIDLNNLTVHIKSKYVQMYEAMKDIFLNQENVYLGFTQNDKYRMYHKYYAKYKGSYFFKKNVTKEIENRKNNQNNLIMSEIAHYAEKTNSTKMLDILVEIGAFRKNENCLLTYIKLENFYLKYELPINDIQKNFMPKISFYKLAGSIPNSIGSLFSSQEYYYQQIILPIFNYFRDNRNIPLRDCEITIDDPNYSTIFWAVYEAFDGEPHPKMPKLTLDQAKIYEEYLEKAKKDFFNSFVLKNK